MRNRTTLQDIAESLGITKVTVSRALKGQAGVGEALRREVEKKAEELGYSRSALHETDRTLNLAFITPKRFFLKTDHFYTDIYYILHRLCDQKKYRISLQIISPGMEDRLELPNNLMDTSLNGLFVGGELSKKYLGKINALKLPTVIIDHYSPFSEFSHVTVDNFYLGYKAALYLIERGHRNLGFVGQQDISSNVTDRILGIQKALTENDIGFREEWIIESHDPRTGLYSMDLHLPEELPTAFICHCDRAAYFLMETLKRRGLSVPDDISVLSFDDTEIAQETTPPLTSIRIDRRLFAEKGFELMEGMSEDPQRDRGRVYLEAELVERDSVRSIST